MLEIPNNRLNGYNIIAQAPVFQGDRLDPLGVHVLLGHDPSRKYPKYVTALASQGSVTDFREWFWGHYFEGSNGDPLHEAMQDFVDRMKVPARANSEV